ASPVRLRLPIPRLRLRRSPLPSPRSNVARASERFCRRDPPIVNRRNRGILFTRWLQRQRTMSLPIRLISTDFDGTLHAECENPPVPLDLQQLIAKLQRHGAKWVINTGRDLSSVMEGIAR